MSILLSSLLILFTLSNLLKGLQNIEDTLLLARNQWEENYNQQLCVRLELLEKNLQDAITYLSKWDSSSAQTSEHQQEYAAIRDAWYSFYPLSESSHCGKAYRLYRQESISVPGDYPNWWVDWLAIGDERP
jgi:hypothetical protein